MSARAIWIAVLGAVVLAVGAGYLARRELLRTVVAYLSGPYTPGGADPAADVLLPTTDADTAVVSTARAERSAAIVLEKIADGFTQPTDIQFVPGRPRQLVVVEKPGGVEWLDLTSKAQRSLLQITVRDASEEGLLGLAFHPGFERNGRFFLSYVAGQDRLHESRIEEWKHPHPGDLSRGTPKPQRTLLTLEQPYQNHNGGQIAFGPDGFLYIGFGDGGLADDPHGHGQNLQTWLGAILRIDVDRRDEGLAYAVPDDNPFRGKAGARPELWAVGLRNPWRFSFVRPGLIVTGDVGQDAWEEIDLVRAGDNLGWNVREGLSCFKDHARCDERGRFVDPIHVYPRKLGRSVTGGHVYRGAAIPALRDKYVFADFLSGRFFALPLPGADQKTPEGGFSAEALGRWEVLPSAFGQDESGELYVAAFGTGNLYRLAPAPQPAD